MKILGLIGGMSWESSAHYYEIINEEVKQRLGGSSSAKIIMTSFDFQEIETLQNLGNWNVLGEIMTETAMILEKAGVNAIVICTNTMHKVVEDMETKLSIPILHIADATAEAIKSSNLSRIGLLGTNYTMEEDFYKGRLESKFGLEVLVPEKEDRDIIHQIIYEELILGKINDHSRKKYIEIINKLEKQGAQGVILGCTEIGMLIEQQHLDLPVFDTTIIHAKSAVDFALS